MSPKPPLLSAHQIVKAFERMGFHQIAQRGSHIKMFNDSSQITIIIPNHREVDRWTLKGILKDAEITVEEFIKHVR